MDSATIYTIGHSRHSAERFSELLLTHGIATLVDVRSVPASRFNPQFNSNRLRTYLSHRGIDYVPTGDTLGGRPPGGEFYDDHGRVLYWKLAQAGFFKDGLEALRALSSRSRVAIMCSEEDPKDCHRRLLIGRLLLAGGIRLAHIRGTGAMEAEEPGEPSVPQPPLLEGEDLSWRSTRPVRQP